MSDLALKMDFRLIVRAMKVVWGSNFGYDFGAWCGHDSGATRLFGEPHRTMCRNVCGLDVGLFVTPVSFFLGLTQSWLKKISEGFGRDAYPSLNVYPKCCVWVPSLGLSFWFLIT